MKTFLNFLLLCRTFGPGSLVALSLFVQTSLIAQTDGLPCWGPTPDPDLFALYNPITAGDQNPGDGGGNPAPDNPDSSLHPAIIKLAASLDNDPWKIYEWVRNNVRNEFGTGPTRGPYLTMLEQAGGIGDQNRLFAALLKAAGYAPISRVGTIAIPRSSSGLNHVGVYEWLGVSDDASALEVLGFSNTAGKFENNALSLSTSWVALKLFDGTQLQFVPFLKPYNIGRRPDITSLTGYTYDNSIAAAKPRIGNDVYSFAIDRAAFRNYLAGLATTCSQSISGSSTWHDLSGAEIAGLGPIARETPSAASRSSTSFPEGVVFNQVGGDAPFYFDTGIGYPLFSISVKSASGETISSIIYSNELLGQSLSVEFDTSQQAMIKLGETVRVRSSFTSTDPVVTVTVALQTPIYQPNGVQEKAIRAVTRTAPVAIFYSFGRSLGRLQKKLQEVSAKEAQDPNSVTLNDRLQILGLQYASQENELASIAASSIGMRSYRGFLLGFGLVRFGCPGIDIQINRIRFSGATPSAVRPASRRTLWLLEGALEGTVVEQATGGKSFGAPTLMDYSSQTDFILNAAKYADGFVQFQLNHNDDATFGPGADAMIRSALNGGSSIYLLQDSAVSYNGHTYGGFLLINPDGSVSSLINRSNGGIGGDPFSGTGPKLNFASDPTLPTQTPISQPRSASQDPVDLTNGGFLKDISCLDIGGAEPLGLHHAVNYNSARSIDNPVGLGRGWTHNYNLKLTTRHPLEFDYSTATVDEVLPIILGTRAAVDAINTLGAEARGWAMACSALVWAVDQHINSRASISLGDRTVEFVKRPDGSYAAPGNFAATLTKQSDGSHTLAFRHGNTIAFRASDGKFISITDPFNNKLSADYDGSGRLTKVTDAYSRFFTFNYDSTGRLYRVDDSTGRSVSYGRDGTTFTYTDPENKTERFEMDGQFRMTKVVDARSRTIVENDYDDLGHVSVQRTFGETARKTVLGIAPGMGFEQDANGGKTWTYFDERGRCTALVDSLNHLATREYDGADRLITAVSPKGFITSFGYDAYDVLTSVMNPAGDQRTIEPDSQHRPWKVHDFEGHETVFTYTSQDKVSTVTGPGGVAASFQYDSKGRLSKAHKAAYEANAFDVITYDTNGNVDKITRPGGGIEDYTFNARGDLLDVTDRSLAKTSFEYNARRQPTKATQWLGSTALNSTIAYDDAGDIDYTTDADGRKTDLEHDALGALTEVKQGPSSAQIVTLTNSYSDPRHLLTTSADGLGNSVTYGYSATQQLASVKDPLNKTSTVNYDDDERPTTTSSPLSFSTTTGWDSRSFVNGVQDAEQQTIEAEYDKDGRIKTLSNRLNKSFTWAYDDTNLTYTSQTPLAKTTTAIFNTRGLPSSVQSPITARKTTFDTYNAEGLLVQSTDAVGTTTFTYWPNGLLKKVTENGHTTYRAYDSANRLIQYDDGEGNSITYEYLAGGELYKLHYPGGKVVTYDYDDFGRLWHVTDWAGRVTKYTYDSASRLVRVDRPNGTVRSQRYDAAGQLKRITEYKSDSSIFLYQQFGFDDDGRITSLFRYPQTATNALPEDNLEYDDDNRLKTWNGTAITFDDNGNMLSNPYRARLDTLSYDGRDRLVGAAGGRFNIRYNPDGLRVEVTGSTYVIDPNAVLSRVLARTSGGITTYYVYGLGLLYEETNGSTVTYHFDQVGSTLALTDESQNITDQWTYSPFGLIVGRTGTSTTPFQFNGEAGVQTDTPSGLYYMRNRYYSPRLMRFINADPIGFAGGTNWYAYAGNDPISCFDPFGLSDSKGSSDEYTFRRMWRDWGHIFNDSWQPSRGRFLIDIPEIGHDLRTNPEENIIDGAIFYVFHRASGGAGIRATLRSAGTSVSYYSSQIRSFFAPKRAFNPADFANDVAKIRAESLARWGSGDGITAMARKSMPKDFASPRTLQRGAHFGSEGEARALARTKLGKNPIEVEPNKLRSSDGRWQYRAKPVDLKDNHVHLERLDPETGEVIENWHLYYPSDEKR